MDVFPNLIGETEFSFFTPADYEALKGVLNDVLAQDIKTYMESPKANPAVVDSMQKFLGPTIESLTLHIVLKEKGIIDLIKGLVPENLDAADVDLDNIIEKLTFLEQNLDKVMTTIPSRNRNDYDVFISRLQGVLARMAETNTKLTYPDIMKRIEDNKFIFYVPNEKSHDTGVRVVSLRKRQWTTALRGAQYRKRCDAENINYIDRRRF